MAKLEIPTANVDIGLRVPTTRGGRVPFDMKSPMGSALQQGASGLDDILNLQMKLNERAAGLDATKATAEFRLQSAKIIDDVARNSTEAGDGIYQTSEEQFDAFIQEQRAKLGSDRARELFDSRVSDARATALASAYSTEATKKAKYTKQSFLDVQNMYGQLLTTNPEELELSLALLDDQIELMGLTDTVAGELRREGQEHLSKMAVQGLIAQDPELAEQMMREGKFPHLADKDQATLLRNADSQARSNKYQNSRIASKVSTEIGREEQKVVTHGLVITDEKIEHLELIVRDIENPRDQKAARARVEALKAIRPLQKNWHKMSIGALKKEIDNVYERDAITDGTTELEGLTLRAARQQLTLKNKTGGSDGKSLSKEASASLNRLTTYGKTPGELTPDTQKEVLKEYEFITQHGTPAQIVDAKKVIIALNERDQTRFMRPTALEKRREKLEAKGDLESTLRLETLKQEIKLKEAARGKDGDPIGLLLRDQDIAREKIDLKDPMQMDLSIAQGRMAANDIGLAHPNTFFRPAERAQLRGQVLNLSTEQWVQMSRHFVENFEGKDFEVLIKDFGEVEPWFGHALSVASLGNFKLSSELFDANKQLMQKTTKGSFAAPTKEDTETAINNVVGNAFQGSGMELSVPSQIRAMANVLYQTRHSGEPDFDAALYEGIVHELVGGDPDDRDDTGIIDHNGAMTLLPSGVTGTMFERFIDGLTSEDFELLGAYGDDDGIVVMSSGPMNDLGDEISPQQISDEGQFVNMGGNVYRIRMSDGNFASDENGDYYQVKIDAQNIDISGITKPRPGNINSPNVEVRQRAIADRFRQKAYTSIDQLKAARDAARQNDKGKEDTTKRTTLDSVAHFVDATVEYETAMRAHDIVTLQRPSAPVVGPNAPVDIDDQDDATAPVSGPNAPVDIDDQDDADRPRVQAADDREREFAVLDGFKVELIELNVGRGGAHATHAAAHSAAEILFDESERTLAHDFLIEIARQESNLGKAKGTFRKKGDRGIWQVNDSVGSGFEETKNAPSLEADRKRIKQLTGIDWSEVTSDDLDVPLIGALAAALYVKRFNASIPQTLQGRAEAWKKFYNTKAGGGTEGQYVANNIGLEVDGFQETGIKAPNRTLAELQNERLTD